MQTNSITRRVQSRFTAPADVKPLSRKWGRAMSRLNVADDQNYLVEVTANERKSDALAVTAQLVALPHADHHALVALLATVASARAILPVTQAALVLVNAAPNGPNTSPTTHLNNAVGLRSAA